MPEETERIVRYVNQKKQDADDVAKERRTQWEELWTLYQNKQDYRNKKDWQSRCFIPKIFMNVEQAAAMVKRAVLSTRRLFKLETKNQNDKQAEAARESIEKEFKKQLDESNFTDVYGEMIKGAFLLGLGMPKLLWKEGLQYYNLDIMDCSIDPEWQPTSRENPKFIIEYKEIDLADLRELANRVNKKARKKIYDTIRINKIDEDFREWERENKLRQRRGFSQFTRRDKKVGITEYWGDIVSEDGRTVERNQSIQIANKKYLIRKHDNPFIHNSPPYVPTVPIIYPHRGIGGVSLAEPIVTMQYAYNNIINLIIDNLNFSVNKIFEIHASNVMNPRNLTAVYPGKIVYKHTPNDAIKEVRTSNVGQDIYKALDFLNTEMEKGTAVTEFITGITGRGKTATEAELKTAQAQGLFDVIARDLEAYSLARLLQMSFDLCIQYDTLPQWAYDRYRMKVGGLSLLLAQREQRANIEGALFAAVKVPELGKRTDIGDLWKKYLEVRNLGEVYAEQPQAPLTEHVQMIQQRAAEDAKNAVSQMSPQEQEQYLTQLQGETNAA